MCKSKQLQDNWAAYFITIFNLNQGLKRGHVKKLLVASCLLLTSQLSIPLYGQFLEAEVPVGGIRINQIGYGQYGPKLAILDSYIFAGQHHPKFYVIALNQSSDTVFTGRMRQTQADLYSHRSNYIADFSNLKQSGHFYLEIPGQGRSFPFVISEQPYTPLLKSLVKAYYFNSASLDIPAKYGGQWARKAGHPDSVVYIHRSAASPSKPAGTEISAAGGWYDAGDYNKYIVNAAFTMNTLLTALNEYPRQLTTLKLNIPANKEGLPDYVVELLYNLRWMLRMQDSEDGGVYHKLTSASFDKMEMPEKDHSKRFVVQKSLTATLDFAAVMARAAITLAPYHKLLPGLEDSLQKAAVMAWKWAYAHPESLYDQAVMNRKYRPKISTGGYEDKKATDEWYQTAISLLLLTKDDSYLPTIEEASRALQQLKTPDWSEVAALGAIWLSQLPDSTINYLPGWQQSQKKQLLDLKMRASKAIISKAQRLSEFTNPGFQTVMGGRVTDFHWGSNGHAASQGWLLMEAFRLTGESKYATTALSNLDYLLGRNPTGYSFVTGMGSTTPMHPHHRISISDAIEDPVPGFLVGGPNPGGQDHTKKYDKERPDLAYSDDQNAYSVNEVAINWNAPLIYLIAAVQASELFLK